MRRAVKLSPSNKILFRLILVLLCVIFFVPKVNIVQLPTIAIEAKPEDFIWLCMLPLFISSQIRLDTLPGRMWCLLLVYLAITVLWHSSNFALVLRMFFYSFPLLYAVKLSKLQQRTILRIVKVFLYVMAIVATLQTVMPFPFFHTGNFGVGPVERSPGIYNNGVEFSLMALVAFWLAIMLDEKSLLIWIAAVTIAILSGTRMVSVMMICSGAVYFVSWSEAKKIWGFIATVFLALIFIFLSPGIGDSRVADIEAVEMGSQVLDVLLSVESSSLITEARAGYCFEFDDTLALDQSLAMRLSKFLFVVQTVVLGPYKLGFGLGRCIGDSGDNLYVRVLSDGGLPYLIGVILFFASMFMLKIRNLVIRRKWQIFMAILVSLSIFYDTLYMSRVSPLIFLALIVAISRSTGTSVIGQRVQK